MYGDNKKLLEYVVWLRFFCLQALCGLKRLKVSWSGVWSKNLTIMLVRLVSYELHFNVLCECRRQYIFSGCLVFGQYWPASLRTSAPGRARCSNSTTNAPSLAALWVGRSPGVAWPRASPRGWRTRSRCAPAQPACARTHHSLVASSWPP